MSAYYYVRHPVTNKLNPLNCWCATFMHKSLYLIHGSHSPFNKKMCVLLLVQCHCPPIWPLALILYLTYIFIVSLVNLPHTSVPGTRFLIHIMLLRSFIPRICPGLKLFQNFYNNLVLCSERLLAPHSTPKLKDHPLSAVYSCLFNVFTTLLNSWSLIPPFTTWESTMLWWQRDSPNMMLHSLDHNDLWQ
jgi:hypothetical protein